jgi:hypothetical protein
VSGVRFQEYEIQNIQPESAFGGTPETLAKRAIKLKLKLVTH